MKTAKHIQNLIKKRLSTNIVVENIASAKEEKILVPKARLINLLAFLRIDPDIALDLLLDISCIEHQKDSQTCNWESGFQKDIFEVFYLLRSTKLGYRIAISIFVDKNELTIPSVANTYLAALGLECELWDMFGIAAEEHPNLKRLIMYQNFAGHPLRRSYPVNKDQAIAPIYDTTATKDS